MRRLAASLFALTLLATACGSDAEDIVAGEPDATPVESDGGIGDGAEPLPTSTLPDGPIPVEPDGGIGDGAEPALVRRGAIVDDILHWKGICRRPPLKVLVLVGVGHEVALAELLARVHFRPPATENSLIASTRRWKQRFGHPTKAIEFTAFICSNLPLQKVVVSRHDDDAHHR